MQVFLNRTQQCFAVRNGRDGLLDVARATFCRITEEIHALIASYQEKLETIVKVIAASLAASGQHFLASDAF